MFELFRETKDFLLLLKKESSLTVTVIIIIWLIKCLKVVGNSHHML